MVLDGCRPSAYHLPVVVGLNFLSVRSKDRAVNRVYFFCKLHPLNWPLAWLLSYRGRVIYYHRQNALSDSRLERCEVIDPAEFDSADDWHQGLEESLAAWRRWVDRDRSRWGLKIRILASPIDFERTWLQWLARSFENHFMAFWMVQRWLARHPEIPSTTLAESHVVNKSYRSFYPGTERCPTVRIAGLLDRIWLWIAAGNQVRFQLRSLWTSTADGPHPARHTFKYFWAGVPPSEVASTPRHLDFAFLVQGGLLARQETLFVLPSLPRPDARNWINQQQLEWGTGLALGTLLSAGERPRISVALLGLALRVVLDPRDRFPKPALLLHALQGAAWVLVARRYQPQVYLSSIATAWPEQPATAVMRSLGIRTVLWHYSANLFRYSTRSPEFLDRSVVLSTTVSQEMWAWNKSVSKLFSSRSVLPAAEGFTSKNFGPVMCGDPRWLAKTPEAARREWGVSAADASLKHLAIFDVPPVSQAIRIKYSVGVNPYTVELLDQFFTDVRAALDLFPQLRVVLKPKKDFHDKTRHFADAMWQLLDPHGPYRSRVLLVDHSVDPYIPVALADICLGLPFTSPILVGLKGQRRGIFFQSWSTLPGISYPRARTLLGARSGCASGAARTDWGRSRDSVCIGRGSRKMPRPGGRSRREFCPPIAAGLSRNPIDNRRNSRVASGKPSLELCL